MKNYLEAYRERMEKNEADLLKLANEVLAINPKIEVYRHKNTDRLINGLVFFDGENINSICFHEVPYRWSGCGFPEFGNSHFGNDITCYLPFTADDVIKTFHPVTDVNNTHNTKFEDKEQYLKCLSYLTKYKPE